MPRRTSLSFMLTLALIACGRHQSPQPMHLPTTAPAASNHQSSPHIYPELVTIGSPPGCISEPFYRPGPSYEPRSPFRLAVPITRPDPTFDSAVVRVYGYSGSVVLVEAFVDHSGNVCAVGILWHSHPSIEQACIQAVKRWKFTPATLAGQRVASTFNTTITVR